MKLRSVWHFGRATFFVVDYWLLWAAIVFAIKLSPKFSTDIIIDGVLNEQIRFIGYGMPLFMALGLQLAGLQGSGKVSRISETTVRASIGIAVGMGAFVLLHILVKFQLIGRYILGFSFLYGVFFVLGSRLLVWKLAEKAQRRILVYGGRAASDAVVEAVKVANLHIHIVGHMRLPGMIAEGESSPAFLPMKGQSLRQYCEENAIEEVVVDVPDSLESREREALLDCTGEGVTVMELGHFFERNLEQVHVSSLRETWFWNYDLALSHPVYFAFKRIVDCSMSVLGLLAFAPLAPFVMFSIKAQDRGPVIYSQWRTGLYNRPFRIFKFRTMKVDAEKHGAQWASTGDSRVTGLGRFLRRTRLDEVPQFWNILKGDMSFIGPRPERPEFVDKIEKEVPFYRYRHSIKPGLSGWAQISYPYGASVDDARRKLAFDFYYVKYASITLDSLILLRTVVAMVKGAR